jgi:hypothetical protein
MMAGNDKSAAKLTREMLSMTDSVWHSPGVPKELRELAQSIHLDVREIQRARMPALKPAPDVLYEEADEQTRSARKRIAQKTEKFAKVVKKTPQFANIEFKCIADYDKCREYRGEYDIHCMFAYFICMAKRIIPFVRQK